MPTTPHSLKEKIGERLKGRVVIACIGNEFKGDDAVGPLLAKKLAGKIKADVVNCQETPENYTGQIKELRPDTIVIVDAVDMAAESGSLGIIEKDQLNELKLYSTHNVPLRVFVDYLYSETRADIFLIGIQPDRVGFGHAVTEKIECSIDLLKDIFFDILGKTSI